MYSQWCERMQQQAIDGTEAYNYFRLKHGVITGADSSFVYIDTEPYSIDLVEIE